MRGRRGHLGWRPTVAGFTALVLAVTNIAACSSSDEETSDSTLRTAAVPSPSSAAPPTPARPSTTPITAESDVITAADAGVTIVVPKSSASDPSATVQFVRRPAPADVATSLGDAVAALGPGIELTLTSGALIGPATVSFDLPPDFDTALFVPGVVWEGDDGSWELQATTWTPGDRAVTATVEHFSFGWPIKIDASKIAGSVKDWVSGLVTGRAGASNPTCGDEGAPRDEGVEVHSDTGDLVKWCYGRESDRDVLKITNNWRAGTQITFPKSWTVIEYEGAGFDLQSLGDWLDSFSLETSTTRSRLVGPGQTIVLEPGALGPGSTTSAVAEISTVSWLWSIALNGIDVYLATVGKLARISGDTKAESLLSGVAFIKCYTDYFGEQIDPLATLNESSMFDTVVNVSRFGIDCGKSIIQEAMSGRGGLLGAIGARVVGVLAGLVGIVYGLVNSLFAGIRALIDEVGTLFSGTGIGGYGYDVVLSKASAPQSTTCENITFNEHGDLTRLIETTGLECVAAMAMILDVGATHYPWGDPPEFSIDGYSCVFARLPAETEGEAGAYGRYECTAGEVQVVFEFYAGE